MSLALHHAVVALLVMATLGPSAPALAHSPLPAPLHEDGAVLTVYVRPDGDDRHAGTSRSTAVRTLARAQEVVQAQLGTTHRNVNVLLASGTYVDPCVEAGGTLETCTAGAAVRWSLTMPGHTIEFRPLDESGPCPVFDGAGTRRSAWFWLRGARGQLTNIVITGVRVQNYWNAVTYAGSNTDPALYNGGNMLRNNVFANIGANPRLVPAGADDEDRNLSFSAVGITNSRKNIVEDNAFADIVTDYKCPWLHALYVAHDSSYNVIVGNRFERACGSPVRIRDHSNFNFVSDNTFEQAGYNGYYEDWFARATECASFGNVFTDNRLVSGFGGRFVPAAVVHTHPAAMCNSVARSVRVQLGGNRWFGRESN